MAELICEIQDLDNIPFQKEYERLELLLLQDQFELLSASQYMGERTKTEGERNRNHENIRLVYLMNDAVESFLVFENARMTGIYSEESEIEYATLNQNQSEYVLIIRQKDSVLSLFFTNLTTEIHLFNYGKIGHFWVKEFEYLRQLEYRIAILRDKCKYLGEEYCSKKEVELSWLAEFPPLNYCCYPAVPKKYAVMPDPDWQVSERSVLTVIKLAEEVDDQKLGKILKVYQRFPSRLIAKRIADMLTQKKHASVIDLLNKKIAEEAVRYKDRVFNPKEEKEIETLKQMALIRKRELEAAGKQVEMLREEPFVFAKDSLEYKVYLMIWGTRKNKRIVEIETFEPESNKTS